LQTTGRCVDIQVIVTIHGNTQRTTVIQKTFDIPDSESGKDGINYMICISCTQGKHISSLKRMLNVGYITVSITARSSITAFTICIKCICF